MLYSNSRTANLQPENSSQIVNIQLLRALAALAVVFYHTAYPFTGNTHTEFGAVSVFFVISGFIMTSITRKNAASFLFNRFSRIIPIYWIATIFAFLWFGSGLSNFVYLYKLVSISLHGSPAAMLAVFKNALSAFSMERTLVLVKSLLFLPIPAIRGPVLGVGWSLNLEIFYYLIYGLALWINVRFAPAIVFVLLVAARPWTYFGDIASFYANDPGSLYTGTLYHSNDNFALGILLYYAWGFIVPFGQKYRKIIIPIGILLGALYVYSYGTGQISGFEQRLLPFLLVFSFLMLETAGFRCLWKPAILLGDASYALYLIHGIIIETFRPISDLFPWMATVQSLASASLAIVISIGFAIAVHIWIERPTVAFLHTFRKKRVILALPGQENSIL